MFGTDHRVFLIFCLVIGIPLFLKGLWSLLRGKFTLARRRWDFENPIIVVGGWATTASLVFIAVGGAFIAGGVFTDELGIHPERPELYCTYLALGMILFSTVQMAANNGRIKRN